MPLVELGRSVSLTPCFSKVIREEGERFNRFNGFRRPMPITSTKVKCALSDTCATSRIAISSLICSNRSQRK